jgi:ribulose 1,5-bisphosphate synthetase/thiazole synthase
MLQDVGPAPQFVRTSSTPLGHSQQAEQHYDVAVCGGTLGIFIATALAQQGFRVAVIEGGPLRGRDQV